MRTADDWARHPLLLTDKSHGGRKVHMLEGLKCAGCARHGGRTCL